MVEVFDTNISNKGKAEKMKKAIYTRFPELKINFDLEEGQRIMRIEYNDRLNYNEIEHISKRLGNKINILED